MEMRHFLLQIKGLTIASILQIFSRFKELASFPMQIQCCLRYDFPHLGHLLVGGHLQLLEDDQSILQYPRLNSKLQSLLLTLQKTEGIKKIGISARTLFLMPSQRPQRFQAQFLYT